MNNWFTVWNKEERVEKIILEMLVKADGFDTGAGSFTVENWLEYIDLFYTKLEVTPQSSVFDVGCGAGPFLYPLHLKGCKVGGLDYSKTLINIAQKILPAMNFSINEAIELVQDEKYDFVVSHSVFHYFPNYNYAEAVIEKMLNKSFRKIGFFDINDKAKEKNYHKIRMGHMNEIEYKEKYAGLEHMFYEKSFFENIAKKFEVKVDIFDQTYTKYANAPLRFNVIMEK